MKDEEKVNKLLKLYARLNEVKAMKKSMLKDYSDQIKELEAEIKDVVNELEDE